MRWRPGSEASDPAEGAYSAPPNLTAGFEEPLHDGERKRKRDAERIGREKERRWEGKE